MSKVYKFPGGGQKVQQLFELGHCLTYEVDHDSDLPEKAGVSGSNSFTDTIWGKDFDTFKRMIESWTGEEVELEKGEEYNSKKTVAHKREACLVDFLRGHKAVTVSGFARECGISHSLLKSILSGHRILTERTWRKVWPVMEDYGYTDF